MYEYFINMNSACNQNYQGKIKVIILQGYVRLVVYKRSAIGERSLCLEEQTLGTSQLKGRSRPCSHAA